MIDHESKALSRIAEGIWKFGETKTGFNAPIVGKNDMWNKSMSVLIDKYKAAYYKRCWICKGFLVRIELFNSNMESVFSAEIEVKNGKSN